jgi:hypothetical protein
LPSRTMKHCCCSPVANAGRRIALDEFDREHIEHGVFVRLIEASTLAGVDALEPQRRPAASVIRRILGVF